MKLLLIAIALFLSFGCGGNAAAPSNAANASNVSPTPASTPAATANAPATVAIDSADGVKLVGSMYAAAKADSPALLMLHQWQSDRHSFDDLAKQMNSLGFAVLAIDGRGFGASTKKADGSQVKAGRTDADVKGMLSDVDAAFQYLSKQANVDPTRIGIIGASYGSSLALLYAADHPQVRAVALLSPGLNYFGNMPTEPAIKKLGSRPALLIAAEDDKESADAVRALAGANAAQKIYAAGGHGTALLPVGAAHELEAFFTGSALQK